VIILQQDGKALNESFEGQIECERIVVFRVDPHYFVNIVTKVPKDTYRVIQPVKGDE